jgi:hypothetical protein
MELNEAYKRYMVFVYMDYFPSGGVNDCFASYDTLKEAIENDAFKCMYVYGNVHIFDCDERRIVAEKGLKGKFRLAHSQGPGIPNEQPMPFPSPRELGGES